MPRKVTNEDIIKYNNLVESYLRNNIAKNWNEASTGQDKGDIMLGNSGYTMNDFRQYLRTEIVVALKNFNPNYVTAEGRTVKEFTFVYQHLFNRVGQLMKKLTKKNYGYGVWTHSLENVTWERDSD